MINQVFKRGEAKVKKSCTQKIENARPHRPPTVNSSVHSTSFRYDYYLLSLQKKYLFNPHLISI